MLSAADSYEEQQKEKLINTLSEKEQPGDINGDGIINVFDVMRYKNSIVEGKDFDSAERIDANSDGVVNGKDITAVKNDILKQSKLWAYQSVPKMDGSTSAIPLEAGLKSKMLGVSYSDAKLLVSHHKTHESFQMLLSGENDMIFTVPISEDQKKAADEAGVKLNFVPVAKEGFVFVVNKNNPVESLTVDQIRDIYSGKITNWKEVGGNDEKIIPYQRNKDSGSQNYMTEFMEGYDLMDPPKDYMLGEMSSLMDRLAVYDNAENAIGYSVYSYAAQMYENASDTKFIAIDGIKPSRETMADGTYPLLSATSIVYTDKASQNTKDFAAWAVSEEGQKTVLSCGYVPVNDMEYPKELKPYYAKGTGKEKPADYKPQMEYSVLYYLVAPENGKLSLEQCKVSWLANKELQNMINSDISETVFNGQDSISDKWRMELDVMNGYINIFFFKYAEDSFNISDYFELNYDAINGVRIEKLSDYFYKDEEFVSAINQKLSENISDEKDIKTDFLGILGEPSKFSFKDIIFEADGPYYDKEKQIYYQSGYDKLIDSMVISEYYDCTNIVDEAHRDDVHVVNTSPNEWYTIVVTGDDGKPRTNVTSRFHTDEEIKAENKLYDLVYEKVKALSTEENISFIRVGRDHLLNIFRVNYGSTSGRHNTPYMFSGDTGEQIKPSDIFGKSFEKYDDCAIYNPDINSGTVTLYRPSDRQEFKETFDIENFDRSIIYGDQIKAEPKKLDTFPHGMLTEDKTVNVYPESYVLDYGEEKPSAQIKKNLFVRVKTECQSHGKMWYECWDGNTDEYIGWICEDDFYLYDRFFSYEEFETPSYGIALGNESGDVVGYTTDSILKKGEKEVQWKIEGKWNVVIKRACYTSNWYYECYDADDGDYYGWIPSKNLVFIEEQQFKGKANGSPDKVVYGYKSSYVLEGGPEEKQWPIEGVWNIKGTRIAKWYDGNTWYECYDADDGDYYGWVKKSDLTLE